MDSKAQEAARELAELILSNQPGGVNERIARRLARTVLGIEEVVPTAQGTVDVLTVLSERSANTVMASQTAAAELDQLRRVRPLFNLPPLAQPATDDNGANRAERLQSLTGESVEQ